MTPTDPGDPNRLTSQDQTDRTSTVQFELTDLTPDSNSATTDTDINDSSNGDLADKECSLPPQPLPPSFRQRFWDKSKLIITDTRTSMNPIRFWNLLIHCMI